MGAAFCVNAALAAGAILIRGPDAKGISLALLLTARFSFLLFWFAYAAGPLADLVGGIFASMKPQIRLFGLAFAAAHLVHLMLVGWLSVIGHAPPLNEFLLFGFAAFWTYLMMVLSFGDLIRSLPVRAWWWIRTIGMNYIMFAFARDFLRYPLTGGWGHEVVYVPFVVLIAVGVLARLVNSWRGGV